MNKTLILTCPKEDGKRYFSKAQHGYENNLNISFNNNVVFKNINDAEEMLPITDSKQVEMSNEMPSKLVLDYDIKWTSSSEKVIIGFVIDPATNVISTTFDRKNFVGGSEDLLEDYYVKLQINDQESMLDKEFHKGDFKKVLLSHPAIVGQPIIIKLESKHAFKNDNNITYDQIELRIE